MNTELSVLSQFKGTTSSTSVTQEQRSISDSKRRSLANLKPFQKGVSGNPGGRPKGQSLTAELRRQAQEGNTAEQIAAVIIKEAKSGKIDFLRLIFDRVDGL